MTFSESSLQIMRDLYQRQVEALTDDTGEVISGRNDNFEGLAEYHHDMVLLGKELGTPFWEVARNDEFIARRLPDYLEILKEQGVDPEE